MLPTLPDSLAQPVDAEHAPIATVTTARQSGPTIHTTRRPSPTSCLLYTEPQAFTFKSYLKVKKEKEKMYIWCFAFYTCDSNAIPSNTGTNY